MWDKKISKLDIKTCALPSINFHNLEVIFCLSLTLITDTIQTFNVGAQIGVFAPMIDKTISKLL